MLLASLCGGARAATLSVTDTTDNVDSPSSEIQITDSDKNTNTVTNVEINGRMIEVSNNDGDTVIIRVGDEILRFPGKDRSEEKRKKKKERRKHSFHGHYDGITFGKPQFVNTDYGIYGDPYDEFMELNTKNTIQFSINFVQEELAFNKAKTFGLVTGLGLSWDNYHFEENITIDKANGVIVPVSLSDYNNVKKTKLTTLYLEVPLLLEVQIREKGKNAPFYISAGGIGGVKLGSHTKIKHSGGKDKDHGSFYINPFRYGATARVGYKNVYVYGNYYLNDLFESNRGPILNQYTIGIGLNTD